MLKWFWVSLIKVKGMHYLVAGKTVQEALDKIAVPYQEVSVSEASWRSIQKAIGCEIPRHANPDEPATGFIPFTTSSVSVAIWPG